MARKSTPKPVTLRSLGRNYARLYHNMVEHKVPKSVALLQASRLKEVQGLYNKGLISEDLYGDWFQEYWYDELYDDYHYDIDEAYPEED